MFTMGCLGEAAAASLMMDLDGVLVLLVLFVFILFKIKICSIRIVSP